MRRPTAEEWATIWMFSLVAAVYLAVLIWVI
jgi:hypothetical protein